MKNTERFFMITPEEFEKIGKKYGLAVQFYGNCIWYGFPDANDKHALDYFLSNIHQMVKLAIHQHSLIIFMPNEC